ncbi:MAG: hypothetical protein UHW99_01980 [Methanobrevibacter sp.]|nr:hypothetical protein [Methanobrevibacter sp.]
MVLLCLMIVMLSFNMVYAQNNDNSTLSTDLSISDGQYEIDISHEKYSNEIYNSDTTNGSVERIYESSANEQNSFNDPPVNIS